LLLSAPGAGTPRRLPQLPIDIFLLAWFSAAKQQAAAAAAVDRWDRHGLTDGRTDTRPLNRRCYTGSVNRYRIQTRKTVSWVASKQTRHACLTASEVEKLHWWWKTVSLHHFIVGGDSNKWLLPVIFVCIFAN